MNISDVFECSRNPLHFISKLKTYHPSKGSTPIEYRPLQTTWISMMHQLVEDRKGYKKIHSDRQLGSTTGALAYALWMMQFRQDVTIFYCVNRPICVDSVMHQMRFMHDSLPEMSPFTKANKTILQLESTKFIPFTTMTRLRGQSPSLLVFDNVNRIDEMNTYINVFHEYTPIVEFVTG